MAIIFAIPKRMALAQILLHLVIVHHVADADVHDHGIDDLEPQPLIRTHGWIALVHREPQVRRAALARHALEKLESLSSRAAFAMCREYVQLADEHPRVGRVVADRGVADAPAGMLDLEVFVAGVDLALH